MITTKIITVYTMGLIFSRRWAWDRTTEGAT